MDSQEIPENIERLFELDPKKDHALVNIINPSETGSDCIVLNIGSSSIKLGVASQLEPFMVPNIIAYQSKKGKTIETQPPPEDKSNPIVENVINSIESDLRRKQYILGDHKTIKSQMSNLMGFKLFDESNSIEKHFNMDMDDDDDQNRFEQDLFTDVPEDYLCNRNFLFTKVGKGQNRQKYFVGEEALSLHKNEEYELFRPVKNGYLNVTTENTVPVCLDALELILRKSISEKLRIPQKNFKYFRCVVALPDMINKKEVKHIANLMLKILGFRSLFFHQESVLATFGTATSYACVVDIGAEKISIACVEDGSIIQDSIVRRNFGGDDQTNLLYHLLHRKKSLHYFPKHILNKHYPYHWNLVNKFKEIYCRWILEEREIVKRCTFWVHDKGDKPNQEITVNCSDCLQVTLLSLFYPELIEAVQTDSPQHMLDCKDYYDFAYEVVDPEDSVDDILQILAEQAQARYGTQNQKKEGQSETPEKPKTSKEIIESLYEMLTLEQLV